MRKDWKSSIVLSLALTLAFASAVAAAPPPVAEVYIAPTKVVWEVYAENDGVILSISGPCGVISQNFKYGDVPVLYPVDPNTGEPLDDGNYTWQLKTRPVVDREITGILKEARETGMSDEVALELKRAGLLPQSENIFGYITVDKGKFLELQTEEENLQTPSANKDFVILDDLIVDGSACIGFDCVNGESFGFDTLRLKENNLRIKFDDTSIAASFPRTDWQLTANDSANGGASKFSIDDISGGRTPFTVEANARSHSLYVDDGGRIGNGTSTPSTEIHTVSGDTPTLRLQQDGSSGFAPQTWDVAGNETNFFIRDVSNGSQLPFRVRPSAPTSSIDIATDGDVGFGTASPDATIHAIGSVLIADTDSGNAGNELLELEASADNTGRLRFNDGDEWNFGGGAGNTFFMSDLGDADVEVLVDGSGDMTIGGTLTENSDVNKKENFSAIDPQEILSKVVALPITTWNYKDNPPKIRHLGPMAQDFFGAFGLGATDTGISTRNVAGVALGAIQGLNAEIETLEAQNAALEAQNADLAARLAALEAMVQSLANGQ